MKGLLPWIGGAIIGAVIITLVTAMSASDTMPAEKHIQGWSMLHDDISYRAMSGEDKIEIIVTYITEGADPRPAWPLVKEMLVDAFADIYSKGYVDCQEKCEEILDGLQIME